jgi:hypothetical protein
LKIPLQRLDHRSPPVPTAAQESSAMRAITIEFDSAGLESFSDESLRRLVCEALTSLLHRKPIQSAMRIEKLRELAKTRGGACLSTIYLGGRAKLEWVCKEGHSWEAVPDRVSRGTWCPVCANVRPSTRTPRPDSAGDASSIMNGSPCRVGSGRERGAPLVRAVPNRHESTRRSPRRLPMRASNWTC